MEDDDLIGFQAQVFRQLVAQPGEGGDAFGEDDGAHRRCAPDTHGSQVVEECRVLGGGLRHGVLSEVLEAAQRLDLASLGGAGLGTEALDALADRLTQGRRGREERLGQRPPEEPAAGSGIGTARLGVEPDVVQLAGDGVLGVRGWDEQVLGLLALGPLGADLFRDLGAVAVPADDEPLHLVGDDRAVGTHGRRFQEADQLGERLGPAIVWSGGGENQGVRVGGEDAGQAVVLGGRIGQVVGLVDDDRIPPMVTQRVQIAVALESVDRDDHAFEERERIAGGRELLADTLNAHRIEPDERDREPAPHLVLHLLEHVAGGDDEDAVTTSAADELRQDHADFERLAQAHGVGEEDARPKVRRVESLADGRQLVLEGVGQHAGRDREGRAVERDGRLAQRRLQPQAGAAVVMGVVGDEGGLGGVEDLDGVEAGVEGGGAVADEIRQALDANQPTVPGVLDAGDQPLLIADHNNGAGGDVEVRSGACGVEVCGGGVGQDDVLLRVCPRAEWAFGCLLQPIRVRELRLALERSKS